MGINREMAPRKNRQRNQESLELHDQKEAKDDE